MSYPRIAAKVAREVWSLEPETFRAILNALNEPKADAQALFGEGNNEGEPPEDYRNEGVALIPVHGIIGQHLSNLEMMCGGCCLDAVNAMFTDAMEDDNVRAIMFDIRSPGGTITGLPELSRKISAAVEQGTKPIAAFTDSLCCSAGLWLAHSAESMFATSSAHIGSVGAYIMLLDASRYYAELGVRHDPVYQGEFKLAGASFKPLTDAERAMFQAKVDKSVAQFRAVVTARHDVAPEHLEGQVYDGDDAAQFGFVDQVVDDLDDAVQQLLLTL